MKIFHGISSKFGKTAGGGVEEASSCTTYSPSERSISSVIFTRSNRLDSLISSLRSTRYSKAKRMCCGWSRREEKSNTHTHTVSSTGCQVCSVTWTCDQLHCSSCSNTYLGTIRSLLSVTDQLCKMTLYRYSPPMSPSTHIIYEKRNNGNLCSRPLSTIRHQYQPLIMARQPLFRFVVAVTAWESTLEFVGPFGTTSCYDRGGWATDATSEHLFFLSTT